MKFYKADVSREQSTEVRFSAPDDATPIQLKSFAEQSAKSVDGNDWESEWVNADLPVEISESEAAEWVLDGKFGEP